MANNKFKAKGFLVWGICALFFLYEFFLRTVIGAYQHPIMQDLSLTSFQFSLLSTTIFLLIYCMMQIPVGIIVDNIGLKKALIIGTLICTISSIGFAYSSSYPIAVFYRMLMGLGASFGFICLLISIYEWMPHRYSAVFIGLSQFIGTLGPMFAAGPLDTMSESMDMNWRFIFLCLGGMGGALMILIFLFVESHQQSSGEYIILHRPEKISTSILRLFYRIQPWYIAVFSASLYFTVEYFSENEGRIFLSLKGIPFNAASYMITISWVGYAIGCPLLGFLSDIFERRKIIMSLCALSGVAAIVAILYIPEKQYLQIAFFILGISASGQSVGFATIAEQFKKQFVAIGLGLNNAMVSIISVINASVIGILLDYTKQRSVLTLHEYLLVFNILIATAVIALVIAVFFIKETYCKSAIDFSYLNPKNATEKIND